MKNITLILLLLNFLALAINAKANEIIDCNPTDTAKAISKKVFNSYVKYFDTSQSKKRGYHENVASCTWGTYKILTPKYIFRINIDFVFYDKDKYYEIEINSAGTNKIIEVLVYDKENATLDNICSDVADWDNPKANRKIFPLNGKIILACTRVKNPYHQHTVSMLIKELTFIDPKTNKTIHLKDESDWEIYYEGMPG